MLSIPSRDLLVHAAGDVDGDGRGETVFGLDRLARRELLIELERGPRRSFVRSRLLLGIALRRLEDDDERDQPRMSQRVAAAHAALPLTTPSLTAMRRATAAPELSAPSM